MMLGARRSDMRAIRYFDYFIGLTTTILWACVVAWLGMHQKPASDPLSQGWNEGFWIGLASMTGGIATCTGTVTGFRVQTGLGTAVGIWWIYAALQVSDPVGSLAFALVALTSAYYVGIRARYFKLRVAEQSDWPAAPEFVGGSARHAANRGGFYVAELAIVVALYVTGLGLALSYVIPRIAGPATSEVALRGEGLSVSLR